MLSVGMLYAVFNLAFCPVRYSPRGLRSAWATNTLHDRGMYFHSNKKTNLPKILRLDRILANRGSGTRKETLTKIKQGRVRVDGVLVKTPSQKFPADCNITVNKEVLDTVPLLMAFYKPLNILSSMGDPIGRPSLLETVPKTWGMQGLHPVGRLDADTTGLLLFSSNGLLTNELLDPNRGVERGYLATVEGDVMQPGLKEKLATGVQTSLGVFAARLVEQKENTVRVVVTEGKYRMVRRILANVGLPVIDLHRTRYGMVSLDDLNITVGKHSPVSEQAVEWAKDLLDKKGERSGRTKKERNRARMIAENTPQENTEVAIDPTLSVHHPMGVINELLAEQEAFRPVMRSYTNPPDEWALSPEEKLDVENESTWKVYEPEFFTQEPVDPDAPVQVGPIEVK